MDEAQARAMWLLDPPDRTTVAVEHEVSSARPTCTRTTTVRRARCERELHGRLGLARRGVGRALAEDMIEWARRRGFRAIQFNAVAESSTAAVALYTALGFETLATIPEAFRHPEQGYVGLLLMYLRLTP